MEDEHENIYLKMPIERVRQDAANGVSLAKRAWRIREPDLARAAGVGILPSQQKRVMKAVRDFYDHKGKQIKRKAQ